MPEEKDDFKKREDQTELRAGEIVQKDDPRIVFRGKLDHADALVVLTQAHLGENGRTQQLTEDLNEILHMLRLVMQCEVLQKPLPKERLLGYTMDELRERSHNPRKYYGLDPMIPPSCEFGEAYALLNLLRTDIREAELAAVSAFRHETRCLRPDLVEGLNRLSSAVHVMLCKELAGEYRT